MRIRLSRRWAIAIVAGLLLGGAITVVAQVVDRPEALEELEAAQSAGEEAGVNTEEIVANLEAIAANIDKGAGLSEQSGEIHELTSKQRESLQNLIGLLRSQLRSLKKSSRLVESTSESAEALERLSRVQNENLRAALAALTDLRSVARRAGATSAELARLAVYGARLAEDSQKAFEP